MVHWRAFICYDAPIETRFSRAIFHNILRLCEYIWSLLRSYDLLSTAWDGANMNVSNRLAFDARRSVHSVIISSLSAVYVLRKLFFVRLIIMLTHTKLLDYEECGHLMAGPFHLSILSCTVVLTIIHKIKLQFYKTKKRL